MDSDNNSPMVNDLQQEQMLKLITAVSIRN